MAIAKEQGGGQAGRSSQLLQPLPRQLCLGLGLSQVGLAVSHHRQRRLISEVRIGQAAHKASDLLLGLGQVFLQAAAQGIEIHQALNWQQHLQLAATPASAR